MTVSGKFTTYTGGAHSDHFVPVRDPGALDTGFIRIHYGDADYDGRSRLFQRVIAQAGWLRRLIQRHGSYRQGQRENIRLACHALHLGRHARIDDLVRTPQYFGQVVPSVLRKPGSHGGAQDLAGAAEVDEETTERVNSDDNTDDKRTSRGNSQNSDTRGRRQKKINFHKAGLEDSSEVEGPTDRKRLAADTSRQVNDSNL
eukprot:CAMPEP_0185572432 /NCGR_PEP_ID=MMETSP0434-20130131/4357_1 /TAXON_ID=626734 ORGANISM="Favella taraikaensis, Strain Fe Narragansett Bay" /NCGR_SAMPLE_ID=MMETSP0434 /ASSEMBLY_ACC=CAM_ASM_000379 /LENGTH=200 /DNA_ID=CAMNT_0028188299 /DNA_START=989 /DNA_END=1593 /DNA_ORIENTATION=+